MRFTTLLLLLVLLVGQAMAQPQISSDRATYVYSSRMKFQAQGLPPQTPIFLYTYFREEGSPEPAPESFSYLDTITTGPMGIIEGETSTPAGGNMNHSGVFILEARAENMRNVVATLRVKIVPLAVTPEFVGYEDTNGFLNLVVTGFIGFPNLYCHYIYQQPGKPNRELKTLKVGPLDGEGSLRLKFKKFPFSPIPKGGYLIQFDGYEKYQDLRDNPSTPDKPYVLFSTSVV